MAIKIINPGLFTTVQDLGRFGYESSGFSTAGAMDYKSFHLANALLNNTPDSAVLEMTLSGSSFVVMQNTTMAAAGANMPITVNDVEYKVGNVIQLAKGDVVNFARAQTGARTYVAFSGGIDVPKELGSYSTHTRSGIGGFKGRTLRADDIIRIKGGSIAHNFPTVNTELELKDEIRVILGHQYETFDETERAKFFSSDYTISKDSDRMGYRLFGEAIHARESHDILSESIQFGNIQIPKNGQPIILLADRQTAGGYTKIGTVAKVDLPVLAQKHPGDTLKFIEISIEEATKLYKQELTQLNNGDYITTSNDFHNVRRIESERIEKLLGGNK